MGGRSELTKDLVENILVRVPVKSLMRFKCVDKSWDALFKTPTFINTHFHIHHRNNNEELFIISNREHSFIRLFLMSETNPRSEVDMQYLFPSEFDSQSSFDQKLYDLSLQGHCNGVLCLCAFFDNEVQDYHKIILWNPATRDVKVVPPPSMPSHHPLDLFCGFGADPNSNFNDLKIVNLLIDPENRFRPPSAELYNLATNSWTLITNHTVPVNSVNLCPSQKAFLANGVCYWPRGILGGGGDPEPQTILCFDFRNNQFHKLKRPPTAIEVHNDFVTEVNDSVAYVVHCHHLDHRCSFKIEIWILEQDSWIKKYNFAPFHKYLFSIYAIWKDGAEFVGGPEGSYFVSYNSDCQPVRHFDVSSRDSNVRKYVESIVSLSF